MWLCVCVGTINITQAGENSSVGPQDGLKIAEKISLLRSDL